MNVRGEVKKVPNGHCPGAPSYIGTLYAEDGTVVYRGMGSVHQADATNRMDHEVAAKGYTVIPWEEEAMEHNIEQLESLRQKICDKLESLREQAAKIEEEVKEWRQKLWHMDNRIRVEKRFSSGKDRG